MDSFFAAMKTFMKGEVRLKYVSSPSHHRETYWPLAQVRLGEGHIVSHSLCGYVTPLPWRRCRIQENTEGNTQPNCGG